MVKKHKKYYHTKHPSMQILTSNKDIDLSKTKKVMPGEFFSSDPVKLDFKKDEYLCKHINIYAVFDNIF